MRACLVVSDRLSFTHPKIPLRASQGALALAALFALSGSAQATGALLLPMATSDAPLHAVAQVARDAAAQPHDIAGFGRTVGGDALGNQRGGDGSTAQAVDIRGGVDGNIAVDTVSGGNTVGGGAFGNAAGINTVIQNSGSNVLIQSGMNVNVQFVDPGR